MTGQQSSAGKRKSRITIGRVLIIGIPLIALGFSLFVYLRDQSTLESAKQAFENADCETALADLRQLESDPRLLDIGSFASDGKMLLDILEAQCTNFATGVASQTEGDTGSALIHFHSVVQFIDFGFYGTSGDFVDQAVHTRLDDMWANVNPTSLQTEEICNEDLIFQLERQDVLLTPENQALIYAECTQFFASTADYRNTISWYADATERLAGSDNQETLRQRINTTLWGNVEEDGITGQTALSADDETAVITPALCGAVEELSITGLMPDYFTNQLLLDLDELRLYGECALYFATVENFDAMLPNALDVFASIEFTPELEQYLAMIYGIWSVEENVSAVVSAEFCNVFQIWELANELDRSVVPLYNAECALAYLETEEPNVTQAIVSFETYITTFPLHPQITTYREAIAQTLWDEIRADEALFDALCTVAESVTETNLYLDAEADPLELYTHCVNVSFVTPQRVIALYQHFINAFPDHPAVEDMTEQLAQFIVDQAQASNAGEIPQPEAIPQTEFSGVVVFVQNASPERIRITMIGTETFVEEIEACTTCPTYTTPPPQCPEGGPEESYEIAEGTYAVVVESISDTMVIPFRGTWIMEDGNMYPNCFFIVRQP